TCLTPFAESFSMLFLFRVLAGLGLGGATACFITMSAEYSPAKQRAVLVSLLWAGYPLGNSVGGFIASYLIPNVPAVFYAGGVPSLIIALLLFLFMPESLRWLAANGGRTQAEGSRREGEPLFTRPGEMNAKNKAA